MIRMLACAVVATPGLLLAAETPAERAPDAQATYQSALQGYRPFADEPVRPWREVNDEVGKLGGWRAYGRESYEARQAERKEAGSGAAR